MTASGRVRVVTQEDKLHLDRRALLAEMRRELTAPVTAILGYCDRLRQEFAAFGPGGLNDDLARIHAAARHLLTLSGRLLEPEWNDGLLAETNLEATQAKICHDLRNPLNVIKGYGEILLEDIADIGAGSAAPELTKLLGETKRLLDSLESIIDFSRGDPTGLATDDHPLPMAEQLQTLLRPGADDHRRKALPGRILVVDDNESNRELLARHLKKDGHRIDMAEGGRQALEMVDENAYDAILLDLMMPEISGYEVLTRLKEQPRHAEIPVIMISAVNELDSVVRCIEAGADDYLPKPINATLLAARVDNSLERKQVRDRDRFYLRQIEEEKNKSECLLQEVSDFAKRLQATLDQLRHTQADLIQAEKMASLGGLVAGVAHEINTPVGIALSAASTLSRLTGEIRTAFDAERMRRSDLVTYLGLAEESSQLILGNATRAAELIRSFKRVSVDQASEARRRFLLAPYLNEILVSLSPNLKRQAVKVTVDCPEDLELDTFPGALSQVITNCVINSLIHGFEDQPGGALRIDVSQTTGDLIEIRYSDDGKGIPAGDLGKIFDPFFTTRRSTGGSGLGLHIAYNLVASTLKGEISVASQPGKGAAFTIRIPRIRPDEKSGAGEAQPGEPT